MGFVCLRAPNTGVVVGSIILATASATGAAAERLHMPYDCFFDGFQVQLEPSGDRSYDIIGSRESDILTACAPYDANRCRSWKVHRFRFQCGGVQVSWLEAAAAAARMTRRDAWVEDGRLHVRMGPMWVVARGGPSRRLREMPGVNAFDPQAFDGHRGGAGRGQGAGRRQQRHGHGGCRERPRAPAHTIPQTLAALTSHVRLSLLYLPSA